MKRLRRGSRGETLVETIVSFSVLFVLLALLAVILRSAARMTEFAAERLAILDEDCTRVEQNAGIYPETGPIGDTLALTPAEPAAFGARIDIPLDVRNCEILSYFSTAAGGGG